MGTTCPKCGYERRPDDDALDGQCPKCGIFYAKYKIRNKTGEHQTKDAPGTQKATGKNADLRFLSDSRKSSLLTKCRSCGKKVSLKSRACPYCGEKYPSEELGNMAVSIAILIAIVWTFFQCTATDEKTKNEKSTSYESAAERAACKKELRCWAEKNKVEAAAKCSYYVEKLAKYDYEWIGGMFEPKFSRYRWKNESNGYVTYIGDQIKFQNGLGAWQRHTYECDFNPSREMVLDVRVRLGRL